MKKIFISLLLLTTLSFVAFDVTPITEATIYYDSPFGCLGCGTCWNGQTQDAFSQNQDDGLAWWGIYNTGDVFGMHFYTYPDSRHWPDIKEQAKMCPEKAIVYYPYP